MAFAISFCLMMLFDPALYFTITKRLHAGTEDAVSRVLLMFYVTFASRTTRHSGVVYATPSSLAERFSGSGTASECFRWRDVQYDAATAIAPEISRRLAIERPDSSRWPYDLPRSLLPSDCSEVAASQALRLDHRVTTWRTRVRP